MPTPQKYANNADRQRAYRQRLAQAREQERAAKGMPAAPPIATMPGTTRWNALFETARATLQLARDEMEEYYNDRSETWQESERAQGMQEKIDALDGIIEEIQEVAN